MPAQLGFDVVIVGAGAAGCVLARRLGERGDRSVALLEAGPDLRHATPSILRDGWSLPSGPDWPDWGFASEPKADGSPAKLRRGRLIGGTSWLTRFAVRGAAADFDGWAGAGNAGWSFDDVLPAFCRLETDLEFGDRAWHGAGGPLPITRYPDRTVTEIHAAAVSALEAAGFATIDDLNRPEAIGVGRMPMSSRDGLRVAAVDGWLPATWQSATLSVRPETVVDRVMLEGDRATGVRLIDGTEIEAALTILCAGVYGSPAILLRSGIGPAAHLRSFGIAVRAELPGVGANLADHPAFELDSGWRGAVPDGPTLHSIATYRSTKAAADGGPDMMFWLTDPDAGDPAFYLDPILLRPRSRGAVRLRSADPGDAPIISLPGLREQEDVERIIEGYRLGVELSNATQLRRAGVASPPSNERSEDELRDIVIRGSYSIPHTVGTCAMGPSPADGAVVDPRGRVHGLDGLAVVDASIIPEPPSGFPHVITMMLAEHLAATL